MVRLILLILVGYVIWKVMQLVARIMSNVRSTDRRHDRDSEGPPQKQKQEFTNVTDAKFEDIPPASEDGKSQHTS